MTSKPPAAPKPPKHLSPEARAIWLGLVDEYGINDVAGTVLVTAACECWQRVREAMLLVAKDGAVTVDRWGQQKLSPAANLERDARASMLAAFRALNLDIQPVRDKLGRPGGR